MKSSDSFVELNQALANQHFAKPTEDELNKVLEQVSFEQSWFQGWEPFKNDRELLQAIGEGVLQKVLATEHIWPIRMLRNEIPRPAALRPYAYRGLMRLCEVWRKEATAIGVSSEVVLAGTSFTRPEDYQQQLVAAGALAAPVSSHTRGVAVDIDGAGYFMLQDNQEPLSVSKRSYQNQLAMRTARAQVLNGDVREDLIRGPEYYDPMVMVALTKTLEMLNDVGIIHHVPEFVEQGDGENMCYHIVFNPRFNH